MIAEQCTDEGSRISVSVPGGGWRRTVPGTPTLIYQDSFQGCDNVFDFSFLTEDQTRYAYNGSLQAAGSLNVNIRYSQTPIPPTARPAAPAPALASATR